MAWTDEQKDRVKMLWADGRSASQIAAEFSVTRNAVIGIISRAGLTRGKQVVVFGDIKTRLLERFYNAGFTTDEIAAKLDLTPNQINRKLSHLYAKQQITRRNPVRRGRPKAIQPKPRPIEPPPSNAIGLFDLTNQTCRWPVSESSPFLFCGAEANNYIGPYCEYHAHIAINPRGVGRVFSAAWVA